MEFSSDVETRKISELVEEFFEHVLYDEEPLFVSDEATIWDVSMATPEELLKRCSEYYGRAVSLEDLKQPLWEASPASSLWNIAPGTGEKCGEMWTEGSKIRDSALGLFCLRPHFTRLERY